MDWNIINDIKILDKLIEKSGNSPQIIFKHSTRCSISSMALNRISSKIADKNYYIIDILAHRQLSNELATRFNVTHESPQILLIHNGACAHDTSHLGISASWVSKKMSSLEV